MHYLEMKGGLLLWSFTLLPLEGKGSTKVFATHSSSHAEQGEDVVGCTLMMNQRFASQNPAESRGVNTSIAGGSPSLLLGPRLPGKCLERPRMVCFEASLSK